VLLRLETTPDPAEISTVYVGNERPHTADKKIRNPKHWNPDPDVETPRRGVSTHFFGIRQGELALDMFGMTVPLDGLLAKTQPAFRIESIGCRRLGLRE
jgi:hypothetical protein